MADNNQDSKTEFTQVTGMWNGKGKVAFTAFVKEDISIPKGAKLLAFHNPKATADNKQPAIRLVYVVEEN